MIHELTIISLVAIHVPTKTSDARSLGHENVQIQQSRLSSPALREVELDGWVRQESDVSTIDRNDIIRERVADPLVSPLNCAIPVNVQNFSHQSIALHHDLCHRTFRPCRICEATLYLHIWRVHQIEITGQEQILSQSFCIHSVKSFNVRVTKNLARHAGSKFGLLATLLRGACSTFTNASVGTHEASRALISHAGWRWWWRDHLAARIGCATIRLFTENLPLPNCKVPTSAESTELHSDKTSRLAPARMILQGTWSTMSIVVSADMVPLVPVCRPLNCELSVAVIEVVALRQRHVADGVFTLEIDLQPTVVNSPVTSMPMPMSTIIHLTE